MSRFAAESPSAPHSSELAGVRLYSPRVLAFYSLVASPQVALILLGMNAQRRGLKLAGRLLVVASAFAFFASLLADLATTHNAGRWTIGLIAAYVTYNFEKLPFGRSMRQGARPAAWWIPLLLILGLGLVLLIVELLLTYY